MAIEKNKTCVFVIDEKQAFFYHKANSEKLIKVQHAFGNHVNRSEHHTKASLGRSFDSVTTARHAIEPHIDERLKEKQRFISEVLSKLERLFADHTYKHLIIIAPAKVLGYIRTHLSKSVKEMVALEIDKDFIHESPEHIQKEAFAHLI
jgi:protein required for attachment to host cells